MATSFVGRINTRANKTSYLAFKGAKNWFNTTTTKVTGVTSPTHDLVADPTPTFVVDEYLIVTITSATLKKKDAAGVPGGPVTVALSNVAPADQPQDVQVVYVDDPS